MDGFWFLIGLYSYRCGNPLHRKDMKKEQEEIYSPLATKMVMKQKCDVLLLVSEVTSITKFSTSKRAEPDKFY